MSDDGSAAGLDARGYVEGLLRRGVKVGASDVHLEPVAGGVEIKYRVDGLLQGVEKLPEDVGRSAVLRLMVLAQLLTYRLDIPQEGRIRLDGPGAGSGTGDGRDGGAYGNGKGMDLRLAVMPTVHGMRAVVRFPANFGSGNGGGLAGLGLPEESVAGLEGFARADGGMLLVTGPAGSGKTTTIYALLEHIAKVSPGLSIISLEDPIERLVPGVTQIEVTPHGQLTYERAIKSILRQDPQVLMLGEIRDAATASLAVQAALSGHRLIATFHAGDPATALQRLLEMGLEPYQITSSVYGVLAQRLVRKRAAGENGGLGGGIGSGYRGRMPVAEFGAMTEAVRGVILARGDASAIRNIFAQAAGHVTLRESAAALVRAGITDAAEIQRVLGQ